MVYRDFCLGKFCGKPCPCKLQIVPVQGLVPYWYSSGISRSSSTYSYYPSGYYQDRLRTCSFGFSYFLPAPESAAWTKNGQPVAGD